MAKPKVESCMDRQTHAIRADDDLYDVVQRLIDRSVTGGIVVDEHDRPVGILSEAECLALLSEGDDGRFPHGRVENFMADAITVEPNMDIYYVAGMFNAHAERRRFAVVDDDGKLIGVVTRKDILKLIHRELMASPASRA